MAREHYQPVNSAWPEAIPPITRDEAERAMRKLARHFKIRTYRSRPRRCWVAVSPPYHILRRGWRRLVHDLSHEWFRQVYPRKHPHDPLHARYEAEMTAYVLAAGWLDGTLRPAPKEKPSRDLVAERAARIEARVKAWETKKKRAETALRKLRAKQRYYQRKLAA
jgi:hypothetical protein